MRVLCWFIGSICLLVVLVVFPAPPARAVEGTLTVQSDIASFSGTLTQAGNQPIRTAFGPLRLDYKSGPNAWTTGLLMREGDGNVTIGAGITSADFNSASKLRVLGVIESTTGGVKFPDGTTQTTAVSGAAGLAQGSIVFYDGTSCPTGYAEVTGARGRTVVGLPAAGTLAGTVGTALTNVEDRTHTHSVDPASTATDSQGAHTHTGPSHTHSQNLGGFAYIGGTSNRVRVPNADGGNFSIDDNGTGSGYIPQSGVSASGTGATSSNGAHTHSVDIASTTSSATSATMPYVQYIVCKASDGAGSSGNGWNDLGTTVVLATSTDSVGIGTTSVTSKLTVAGTVESTTGGFKFPDGTTQTAAAAGETAGQIAFFAAACPTGWTEYTALRGRVAVGTPLSGTTAGTVGTALTNQEDRTHTHSYNTVISHSHTLTGENWYAGTGYFAFSAGGLSGTQSTSTVGSTSGTTATAATSNVIPYIQLTACQKN